MTREEARQYFKHMCKDYSVLNDLTLRKLSNMIEAEFISYLETGVMTALQMNMAMAPIRKKDVLKNDGKIIGAALQVNGSYFERREAVTFGTSGHIGFGCELSDINIQPILVGFCKWCTSITIG